MSERIFQLKNWLITQLNTEEFSLLPVTNDASFRRYYRVTLAGATLIAMDAPPDKEDCHPFVNLSQRLIDSGLNAPEVIAKQFEQGFLLLTDLGNQLYLDQLSMASTQQVENLYAAAINALIVMQIHTSSKDIPNYDHRLLHAEMNLFRDWLVSQHLHYQLSPQQTIELADCFEKLSQSALSQPCVFVHRDYHSRNLMVVPKHNPGILDFQDAVKGPITYDLVSLLRDCYIAWPLDQVNRWALSYYQLAQSADLMKGIDENEFLRWFDWMGIQRHLKASGIFARLYHRDGKSGYLKDIPRTLNYIVEVAGNYPELLSLSELVRDLILPACQKD